MKRQIVALLTALALFPLVNCTAETATITFIVFSDPHVGAGLKADGFNGSARLAALLAHASRYRCPMVVTGDLTVSPFWYSEYKQLISRYKYIEEVKGNHDENASQFLQVFGNLTWSYRWLDCLFVGVSDISETMTEWLSNGITYNASTYAFLDSTILSSDYNNTRHHFLFMHYAPNSTWPLNATHGVPARLAAYYPKFDVIFHGHEGGPEYAGRWGSVLSVKAAHLADGKAACDSYLLVSLNLASGALSVRAVNFVSGAVSTLAEETLP